MADEKAPAAKAAPAKKGAFDKNKVTPDTDDRSDDGLSSQVQFSEFEDAPVGESAEKDENAPDEIAATNPPAGPSTVQTRGVGSPD